MSPEETQAALTRLLTLHLETLKVLDVMSKQIDTLSARLDDTIRVLTTDIDPWNPDDKARVLLASKAAVRSHARRAKGA